MTLCDGLDLLAARAVTRIGLSLEARMWSAWDCGGALRPIRGEIMKQQSKLAGLAVLFSAAAPPAPAQEEPKSRGIVPLSRPAAARRPQGPRARKAAAQGRP